MCFFVYKGDRKVKRAKAPIVCYKFVVDSGSPDIVLSPVQDYAYKLQKLQPRVKFKIRWGAWIGRAMYRWTRIVPSRLDVITTWMCDDESIINSVNRGYHSYAPTNKSLEKYRHPELMIALCIIPEGTLYLEDSKNGEYVSERIIIDRILEPHELTTRLM